MRIADKMAQNQILTNVSKNRSKMSDLQNEAATQKRVTRPSDDPVAASRVLSARVDLQGMDQYQKNLDYAKSFLDFTDQSLDDMSQQLVRVKELLLSQASDASSNLQSRRAVASEVEQIYEGMVGIANRKLGERFIFSGFKTTQSPFDLKGNYKGDNGEIMISVDKNNFVPMNLPGDRIFLGEGFAGDGVSFRTPQQANTIEELIAQNEQSHNVGLNLHLKSGASDSEGSRLENVNPEDLQKNHPTEMRGPASVDRESLNVREINSSEKSEETSREKLLGEFANADDVDTAPSNEGVNIFRVLQNSIIALKSGDKVGVQQSLTSLDSALNQVILARSQVGSRSSVLGSSLATMADGKLTTQAHISDLEDANVFKVVSDINKTESALQATLETSGKLVQKSLLDFLR